MLVCSALQKPLYLFHLVHSHQVVNALVFTKSAESTARLVHLFNFFEKSWATVEDGQSGDDGSGGGKKRTPVIVQAYSSDLPVHDRKTKLEKFRMKEIDM